MRYPRVIKPRTPCHRTPHATLDDKRRLKMATDTARGINYLHSCRPPIVHRDLKSPNLLVDKDFTIKARRATPLPWWSGVDGMIYAQLYQIPQPPGQQN